VYLCPSEINDRVSLRDGIDQYPLNYAANQGTWLVFDPIGGKLSQGAFMPNAQRMNSGFGSQTLDC
jgi:hypothetical protein